MLVTPPKLRIELPANAEFLRKATALLREIAHRKLEAGEHGTVAVSLTVGDGSIKALEDNSATWWKNEASLAKY